MRAIVTGGGSGIGAATAELLRSLGHDVVTWDQQPGADITVDVSDEASVDAAMTATLESGPVPEWVAACAGIGHAGLLLEESVEDWNRVLAVNLTGAWLTLRAVGRAMTAASVQGSIVVVSSMSGTVVDRNMGAYCVSKAGVDMLVKVAAVEFGRSGIRVNAVGPGVTRTPMLPNPERLPGWVELLEDHTALGRLGEPGDIAQVIAAVLGLDWVTGQVLHADGGITLHSPADSYGQLQRVLKARVDQTHFDPAR